MTKVTDKGVQWICDACGKNINPSNGAMSWLDDETGRSIDLHCGDIDCRDAWKQQQSQGVLGFA